MPKLLGVLPPKQNNEMGRYIVVNASGVLEADTIATPILKLPAGNTGINWREIDLIKDDEGKNIFKV